LQARGIRQMLCLGNAVSALTGGLDGNVKREPQCPGGDARLGSRIVCRREGESRVRARAGGHHGRFSSGEFRPREVEVYAVVIRRQREVRKVPRRERPARQLRVLAALYELAQTRVIQPSRVKEGQTPINIERARPEARTGRKRAEQRETHRYGHDASCPTVLRAGLQYAVFRATQAARLAC